MSPQAQAPARRVLSGPGACPCGAPASLENCCGPYLGGRANAPTAEALMRSRYSAFALGNEPYLLATWHTSTRPPALHLAGDTTIKWIGLNVKSAESTGSDSAIVEFVARSKTGGRARRLHEVSRFVREDGKWFYLSGTLPPAALG